MNNRSAIMARTVSLPDAEATSDLGARLGPVLRPGDVVRLVGDLGAGKSTLARGAILAIAGVADAPSPTYTLVETYGALSAGDAFTLWHFDLYRLDKAQDVWELGLEDALEDGALLIEWPEQIDGYLPGAALTVRLIPDGARAERRRALIEGDQSWAARLAAAGIA